MLTFLLVKTDSTRISLLLHNNSTLSRYPIVKLHPAERNRIRTNNLLLSHSSAAQFLPQDSNQHTQRLHRTIKLTEPDDLVCRIKTKQCITIRGKEIWDPRRRRSKCASQPTRLLPLRAGPTRLSLRTIDPCRRVSDLRLLLLSTRNVSCLQRRAARRSASLQTVQA